jgi:hypothetical protein
MSDSEGGSNARWSFSKYLIWGFTLAGVGYLPLQLYILFGPRDGNPVGLGLLAVLAILSGLVIFGIGLIKLAVQYFLSRRA